MLWLEVSHFTQPTRACVGNVAECTSTTAGEERNAVIGSHYRAYGVPKRMNE